ncbi:CRM-domain containing factor CFM2, chloroplastic-like isoform X3 [Lotus japonicus]|nr:CRM-domain containing factor CFM2, chloroplastic-like isoform X3 [Lotus japonicus]
MDRNDENCDERERHSSETNSEIYAGHSSNSKTSKPALIQGVGTPNKVRFQLPGEAELAEDADSLLVGLGPRFTDWWGYEPLPVDADLLPAVVPGYRQPFRLLPYGVKPKLTDDEMTTLRRLSRPIPSHFALGRNKKLQGLAAAIIKLWERCEIVKIAVKRGVQNTNSEMMAEEIKSLKLHVLNLDKNINELKLQMVKDEEANSKQMPETSRSDLVTDKHGTCTNSTSCNSPKEASLDNQPAIQEQQVELIDGGGARPGELGSWAGSIHKETQPDVVSDSVVDAGHCVSNEKEMESSITSSKSDPEPPASVISRRSNVLPSRSVFLSNRERLLLRKQALQMKKRPVLAIGKSNTVSGIAKAIKTHFQKHSLAIVNVKGRAKGTSVQEVVFKLEQATGAVLVSQEPSKVILYRGWGAGEKPGNGKKVNEMIKEEEAKPIVSPELLEAIRVECGLQ